ncbi:MAG: NAD(+)/NADH kinase [Erysipelotrichaceae bacterium]|nr:NAD(+)/NADH kinase [Erysipelotrichaceae bacterium]
MKPYYIIHRDDAESKEIAKIITERLGADSLNEYQPEVVFVVGGDGTFLTAVHRYLDILDKVGFVAIHTGTLGFFTDYQAEEVAECLHDYQHRQPLIREAKLLKITVSDQVYYAVNELRIENVHRTQMIDVFIDDTYFETFRGTGICVATQLGSTAYNRSLGGSIIVDGLELLQLSEIAGIHHKAFHSLGSSLILKETSKITLKGYDYEQAVMCYDHKTMNLHDQLTIECSLTAKAIRFFHYRDVSYLKRLNSLF